MKPMMKSVRQQTFMARQKKLAKVMQQDNGSPTGRDVADQHAYADRSSIGSRV